MGLDELKSKIDEQESEPTHDETVEVCSMLLEEYGFWAAYDWVRYTFDDFHPKETKRELERIAQNRV
ncbi:hypothetical protein GCM10008985_07120 [Halococcus dombrowskii]|uniref:Uncharacterized protein n=1 Tax=Halococcus dombrowskii TaxID=179637 RepID=A0AAV3SED1_HALDO